MAHRPTKERIEELASRPNVKKIPVFNFLGTLPSDTTIADDLMNLDMDAKLYGWNVETVKAIRDGILNR